MLFVEGILTFLSPCILPMVPLYLSYFIGRKQENGSGSALRGALLFVIGFSLVFMMLSIFVNTVGRFVLVHRQAVQWGVALLLILFGLDQLFGQPVAGRLFKGSRMQNDNLSGFMLGVVFAISWTPCIGVYLAAALSTSLTSNNLLEAVWMLTAYCLGLGIPFVLSALVVEESQQVITVLKRHMGLLQKISGILMILFGILIGTGYIYAWITF